MNKKLWPALLGGLLACLTGAAACADPPAKAGVAGAVQHGESSIHAWRDKDGCRHTEAKNLRFTPTTLYEGTKSVRLILRETFERSDQDCADGFSGMVTVEATAYDEAYKKDKTLWTLSTDGWSGDLFEDGGDSFYRVTVAGCCGSSDTDVYFSLHDGKQLFQSTEPLMKLQLTHGDAITKSLYLAIQDNNSAFQDGFKVAAGSDSALAVLSMGSDRDPAGRVVISRAKGDDCHSDELSLVVDGKASDEKKIDEARFEAAEAPKGGAGLFIQGKLDCLAGEKEDLITFDVPIVKGHLSATGAKASDAKVTFAAGKG